MPSHELRKQYQVRADPLFHLELEYLRTHLKPLTNVRLDNTMMMKVALSTLVRDLDDIRKMDDGDTKEMRGLLLGSQLRNAGHTRPTGVRIEDIEQNPTLTLRELNKAAIARGRDELLDRMGTRKHHNPQETTQDGHQD
jgi:hypothetical protein